MIGPALYDALRPWILGVGSILYVAVGVLVWKRIAWAYRVSYVLGGGALAFYEFHMWWCVAVAAIVLVGMPLGSASITSPRPPSS